MYQFAQTKQRRADHQHQIRAVESAAPVAVGRTTLTQNLDTGSLGPPDYYTHAVEAATREIHAVRVTALPALVAVRRNRELSPLAKQIELAKVAMQVRHLLLAANKHVFALERAQSFKDPMVQWLRGELDLMITRATALGAYENAENMRPERYIEPKAAPLGGNGAQVGFKKTGHTAEAPRENPFASVSIAQVTRAASKAASTSVARNRLARGTRSQPTVKAVPSQSVPSELRTSSIRPGFRPSAR